MKSKTKGKVGERETAALLRAHGFEARRGVQFQGGPASPDVVHSIPGIHIEVKRCEALGLYDAMAQAQADAGGDIPVVLHRRNDKPWLVICFAEDWLTWMKRL
jgi:Holliday junction resolvase